MEGSFFALLWFAAVGWLLFAGIRKLHNQELAQRLAQAEQDTYCAREEGYRALHLSRKFADKFAERVGKVVCDEQFIDYLIARQMALPDVRQASEAALQREAELQQELRQQAEYYRQRDAVRIAEFTEIHADYRRLQEDENRRRADEVLRERTENFECQRRSSHYTPPQCWQAQAQALLTHRRGVLPCWDDEVLDVDVRPVSRLPVYPPALQALPPAAPRNTPPALGGRQRKYASDAERQAAYRARQRERRGY